MDDIYSLAQQFKILYRVPPGSWLLIAAVFLAFWSVLMLFLDASVPPEQHRNTEFLRRARRRGKTATVLNLLLALSGLAVIVMVTFVRQPGAGHRVIFYPLRVLYGMRAPGDYWQVTVMNLVLCVPFACGLAFLLGRWGREGLRTPGRARRGWASALTVLICLLLSAAAETLQYFTGSGLAEVDDVLMNTLGGALGTVPYTVLNRRRQN